MTGGMKRNRNISHGQAFTHCCNLLLTTKICSVAHRHNGERFTRGQHMPMACSGVISVGMGDQGAGYGSHGIDMEITHW
jgi:hypothetical protein